MKHPSPRTRRLVGSAQWAATSSHLGREEIRAGRRGRQGAGPGGCSLAEGLPGRSGVRGSAVYGACTPSSRAPVLSAGPAKVKESPRLPPGAEQRGEWRGPQG